jgi:hypothetical protein
MKKILVTEAVVKTVQVEIKALTLNGKQMTLSVFRQLEHDPLINIIYEDTNYYLQLLGKPWGKVNYHAHCLLYEHLHVIWQKNNELKQSTVYSPDAIKKYLGQDKIRYSEMNNFLDAINADPSMDFGIKRIDDIFYEQFNNIYQQLISLGQLFIAV